MALKNFQLLTGTHREGGKTYRRGDYLQAESNLLRFNTAGNNKFRLVKKDEIEEAAAGGFNNDGTQPDLPDEENDLPSDTFESMTIPQLKEYAEAEEIDLGKNTKRDDIIAALRAALAANSEDDE